MAAGLLVISCWPALTEIPLRSRPDPARPPGLSLPKTKQPVAPGIVLPPAPEGVTDFSLERLYVRPAGRKGLEFTPEAKALENRRVRLTGYQVRQTQPIPWAFLLSPVPLTLHEREYGLADDLPATAVHVFFPRSLPPVLPWERSELVVIGTLSLGNRDEADGRVSAARVVVDVLEFGGNPTLGTVTPAARTNNSSYPSGPFPAVPVGSLESTKTP